MTVKQYSCSHRIGKAGPPPHSLSMWCVTIRGVQCHLTCHVSANTHEPLWTEPKPCDQSCSGYMKLSEKGAIWLQALSARQAINAPSLGTGK